MEALSWAGPGLPETFGAWTGLGQARREEVGLRAGQRELMGGDGYSGLAWAEKKLRI